MCLVAMGNSKGIVKRLRIVTINATKLAIILPIKVVIIIKEKEIWKLVPIQGLKYEYTISSFGRVANRSSGILMRPDRVHGHGNSRGTYYRRIGFVMKDGTTKRFYVHILVALTYVKNPDPDNKRWVNHKDGVTWHNYYWNLEWVTKEENMRHAYDNGLVTIRRGINRPESIYTNELVISVCELLEKGYGPKKICKTLGLVCDDKNQNARWYSFVKKVKYRINWTHISKDYKF